MALATASSSKIVLVTGASRGIGKALCQTLLKEYPEVRVLLGSRNAAKGNQVAQEIISNIGSECKERLEVVEIDTASEESVAKAAEYIQATLGPNGQLFGIVNNAGIFSNGYSHAEVMNTNYWGPRRVNDALLKLLKRPGGRIVNVSSASGPSWVSSIRDSKVKSKLSQPWMIQGGIEELDQMARTITLTSQSYGISKAFLNAYTCLHAQAEPDLIINAVTPGFIATDMGTAMGATNPVEKGVIAPLFALLEEELESTPTGRYYGSDCKRSPLDVYRGPGEPVFVGPDWKDALQTK